MDRGGRVAIKEGRESRRHESNMKGNGGKRRENVQNRRTKQKDSDKQKRTETSKKVDRGGRVAIKAGKESRRHENNTTGNGGKNRENVQDSRTKEKDSDK